MLYEENKIKLIEALKAIDGVYSATYSGQDCKAEIVMRSQNQAATWLIELESPDFDSNLSKLVGELKAKDFSKAHSVSTDLRVYKINPDPEPDFPELKQIL